MHSRTLWVLVHCSLNHLLGQNNRKNKQRVTPAIVLCFRLRVCLGRGMGDFWLFVSPFRQVHDFAKVWQPPLPLPPKRRKGKWWREAIHSEWIQDRDWIRKARRNVYLQPIAARPKILFILVFEMPASCFFLIHFSYETCRKRTKQINVARDICELVHCRPG